jgi:hypothetical protein
MIYFKSTILHMLKKLQLKIPENTALGLFIALVLLFFSFSTIGTPAYLEEGYHYLTKPFLAIFLFSIGIALYTFKEYSTYIYLEQNAVDHKSIDNCHSLILTECVVVKIVKHMSPRKTTPVYDVYFDYKKTNREKQRGFITVGLDEGEILLTSLQFRFAQDYQKTTVVNMDYDFFLKTHTRVPVECKDGTVLRKGSRHNYEFIKAEKFPN